MKCPHCLVAFHDNESFQHVGEDIEKHWFISRRTCSACKRFVLALVNSTSCASSRYAPVCQPSGKINKTIQVYPLGSSRTPCPADVPDDIANDYREACLVLPFSPKASAALSRRCLQHLLRDAAKVKKQDLAREIDAVLSTGTLPTHIANAIDAIRQTGNFAAHPTKSTNTGEIVDVEPHEAEWNLDVLELLFDFYYVQPTIAQQRIDAMNAKLASANKPPMK